MADNSRKTPLALALDSAARSRSNDVKQLWGKELPCSVSEVAGQLVTVSWDIKSPFTLQKIQVPMATSKYDWIPHQAGDKGVAVSADAYMGGQSGIGGGTADLSRRGNLSSTLVFQPVSNKEWQPPGGDPNKRAMQGPNGFYMQSVDGAVKYTGDKTNGHLLEFKGSSIGIDSNGDIRLTAHSHTILINSTGVVIDGKVFLTHEHTNVTTGGDDTGPVA